MYTLSVFITHQSTDGQHAYVPDRLGVLWKRSDLGRISCQHWFLIGSERQIKTNVGYYFACRFLIKTPGLLFEPNPVAMLEFVLATLIEVNRTLTVYHGSCKNEKSRPFSPHPINSANIELQSASLKWLVITRNTVLFVVLMKREIAESLILSKLIADNVWSLSLHCVEYS